MIEREAPGPVAPGEGAAGGAGWWGGGGIVNFWGRVRTVGWGQQPGKFILSTHGKHL